MQTVSKAQTWGLEMFKDTSAADIEAQRAELNRIEASHNRNKQKPLKTDNHNFPGLPQADPVAPPKSARAPAKQ